MKNSEVQLHTKGFQLEKRQKHQLQQASFKNLKKDDWRLANKQNNCFNPLSTMGSNGPQSEICSFNILNV